MGRQIVFYSVLSEGRKLPELENPWSNLPCYIAIALYIFNEILVVKDVNKEALRELY